MPAGGATLPGVIIHGGTIYTGDPEVPRVRGLPIDNRGRITRGVEAWEGDTSAVSNERIDLEGRTVVPGFVDAHVHFLSWALAANRVDVRLALTGEAALALVAERAATDRTNGTDADWLIGGGWTEQLLADIADPAAALDRAVQGRPAALWARDHHALWLSTRALELLGGGEAIRRERDAWAVPLPEPTRVERQRAVAAGQTAAHALGITGVHDFEWRLGRRTWQELDLDDRVSLRVVMAVTAEHIGAIDAIELVTGFGSDHVKVGPVKAFCDGTLGARTANMLAPYADGGTGMDLLPPAALVELITTAAAHGMPVALHAIGDAAVRNALDALEATRPAWLELAEERPPRIEHAQLVHPDDLARFAALGVVASMQPAHAAEDRTNAETAWGDRCSGAYAWRSLHDAGATLIFGSDAPISPLNPLAAIGAATSAPLTSGQQVDAATALAAISTLPSHVAGLARTVGRLAPGRAADLVVLDADPHEVAPEEIASINVVATMVGGRWVYGRPPW